MLVNKTNNNTSAHVKFIEYTGDYPNLCSGVLTLEIDGVRYKFGHNYTHYSMKDNVFTDEDKNNPNFESFWSSGGCVKYRNGDYDVSHGEWEIDVEQIPEQFQKYADEIDSEFNENVQYGCCGGCI